MNTAIQSAGDLAMTQAQTSNLARYTRKDTNHNVDASAREFEGMFMSQMLQPMFDTVGVNKLFGGGHGEEMMRGFMVQEYGKAMAKAGGFGIAANVRAELIRVQEHQSSAKDTTSLKGASDANGQTP